MVIGRDRRFLEYLATREEPGEVGLVLLADVARAMRCSLDEARRTTRRLMERRLISVIDGDPVTWYVALTPEGREDLARRTPHTRG
jgi:hypothetical protein